MHGTRTYKTKVGTVLKAAVIFSLKVCMTFSLRSINILINYFCKSLSKWERNATTLGRTLFAELRLKRIKQTEGLTDLISLCCRYFFQTARVSLSSFFQQSWSFWLFSLIYYNFLRFAALLLAKLLHCVSFNSTSYMQCPPRHFAAWFLQSLLIDLTEPSTSSGIFVGIGEKRNNTIICLIQDGNYVLILTESKDFTGRSQDLVIFATNRSHT